MPANSRLLRDRIIACSNLSKHSFLANLYTVKDEKAVQDFLICPAQRFQQKGHDLVYLECLVKPAVKPKNCVNYKQLRVFRIFKGLQQKFLQNVENVVF